MQVGAANFKIHSPEEQDSGESNKFGSAGSNAFGSAKQSQGTPRQRLRIFLYRITTLSVGMEGKQRRRPVILS